MIYNFPSAFNLDLSSCFHILFEEELVHNLNNTFLRTRIQERIIKFLRKRILVRIITS